MFLLPLPIKFTHKKRVGGNRKCRFPLHTRKGCHLNSRLTGKKVNEKLTNSFISTKDWTAGQKQRWRFCRKVGSGIERIMQIVLNDLQRTRHFCNRMIWLLAHPLTPPLSCQQVVSLSKSFCVSPVDLNFGRGGRG